MAAIEVLKAGEVLETIQVEQDVFRVGSDPSAAVQLPSGPAHRLTVVARNGRTQVVNRHSAAVRLSNRSLAQQATGDWMPGQAIELSDGLAIRLKSAGGRKISRRRRQRPSSATEPVSAGSAELNTPTEKKPKDHLTTSLLALLTVAMMVFVLGMSGPGRSHGTHAEFLTVVNDLATLDDPRFKHVRALLQEARTFELRDMPTEAAIQYTQALDVLRASGGGSTVEPGSLPIVQQALAYTELGYRRVGS